MFIFTKKSFEDFSAEFNSRLVTKSEEKAYLVTVFLWLAANSSLVLILLSRFNPPFQTKLSLSLASGAIFSVVPMFATVFGMVSPIAKKRMVAYGLPTAGLHWNNVFLQYQRKFLFCLMHGLQEDEINRISEDGKEIIDDKKDQYSKRCAATIALISISTSTLTAIGCYAHLPVTILLVNLAMLLCLAGLSAIFVINYKINHVRPHTDFDATLRTLKAWRHGDAVLLKEIARHDAPVATAVAVNAGS